MINGSNVVGTRELGSNGLHQQPLEQLQTVQRILFYN